MNSENDNNSRSNRHGARSGPDRSLPQATQGDLAIQLREKPRLQGRELIRPLTPILRWSAIATENYLLFKTRFPDRILAPQTACSIQGKYRCRG
jgi:hypothetical protein